MCKDKTHISRLFYEAALGLDYMHQRNIVHGSLNCRHFLVDAEMKAKISGFNCASQTSTATTPTMTRSDLIRWRAPELLSWPGRYAALRKPVPASDVYPFGMSIWEAFAGHPPFDDEDYDTILEKLLDENFSMPGPENLSGARWKVVLRMLDCNWQTRLRLKDVIAVFENFMTEEAGSRVELHAVSDISENVIAKVHHSELGNLYISREEVQFGEHLADGAFGKIYRGIWNKLTVVIKRVEIASLDDKQTFLREIKVWSEARHRHIVQFHGACDVGPQCLIVSE